MLKHELEPLFENNRRWAKGILKENPGYFDNLSRQQNPDYLWIGCADSRVPANELLGLAPGEVFVHRNVANIVVHTDMNCLSVIQYAVEVLKVEHIIICGHYGCGGVLTAMQSRQHGLIDNWLRNIKDVYRTHQAEVDALAEPEARANRMCELNVAQQVANVCYTTIVQNAWQRGQKLTVHGWIYSIKDGLLHDTGLSITGMEQLPPIYRMPSS